MKTPVGSRLTAGSMPRIGVPRGPGGHISGIIAPPRVHNVILQRYRRVEPVLSDGPKESVMRRPLLFIWLLVLSVTAHAQWLNFQTPGVPRTADGKPNLSAPAPRTADGKPDLSGVWMHETTTIAGFKRLFGPLIDAEIATSVPGMELDTVHRYAVSLLVDFKPNEQPLTALGGKLFLQSLTQRDPARVRAEPPR